MSISVIIAALPDPPSRADPVNFDPRADAFVDALVQFGTELNGYASQANAMGAAANGALAAATVAVTSAQEAAAAVVSQGTATPYSAGTSYAQWAVCIGADGRVYRRTAAGSAVDPVTDLTGAWVPLNPDLHFAAALILGTGVYPGWALTATGVDGVSAPVDPAQPACLVWARGVERYRATLTWGVAGGAAGCVTAAALAHSINAGTHYTALAPVATLTIGYDSAGNVTGTTWS
ncbi:MAG: hypothetical protein JZU52_12745 [Lamprocystis purpurea]|jgi:hypothetical protein|uniref:hypothetical protein n=1 Tax=Lamprocystis purpurea TaxID=61598 RepID=UPI0003706976|nr:hypothetical protein [Lamprocystis purpurea]MBV5274464.1 hypothetical protein [Lamprocystis purpurea]